MRNLLLTILIASLTLQCISAKRLHSRRRIQSVVDNAKAAVASPVEAGATPISDNTAVTNPKLASTIANNSGLYRWVIGGLKTVVGIPLCFFGFRWWGWNALVSGVVAGFTFGNVIEKMVMQYYDYTTLNQWLWLAGMAVLCVLFAFAFSCWKRCASSFLGALLGLLIYNMTISVISVCSPGYELPEAWILLIVLGGALGLGFFLGCLLKKTMIITTTAVAGGWTFVCGVGTLVGHFPEPYVALDGWVWFTWLAAAIACMTLGLFVQICTWKKSEDYGNHQTMVEVDIR